MNARVKIAMHVNDAEQMNQTHHNEFSELRTKCLLLISSLNKALKTTEITRKDTVRGVIICPGCK